MKKTRQLFPILLSVSVLMLVFSVSTAEARGGSFTIEPMQEAVENVALGISDQVVGNLTVTSGSVDFFVADPNGTVVLSFSNVSDTSFNFTAVENGAYSIHLNNTYQASSVTVELDYGINMTVNLQAGINVGYSLGVAQVVAPAIRPSPPDIEGDEPSDYVVAPYLNFLQASDILKTMRNARSILPIDNLTLSIIAFVAGLAIVVSVEVKPSSVWQRRTESKWLKWHQ